MKRANQYWTVLALLGFFHLNLWLGERIPFYILIVMTGGVAYFLSRRVLLHLEYVGWKWNGLLAVLQGLLFFFYIVELPFWLHLLPLTLFIGLEFVRAYWGEKIAVLLRNSQHHEEQLAAINETFRMVRSERHDFLKHVSALHFMLEDGRSIEAKKYLDALVDNYEETNFSIKGERGAVAGVLHQTYKRAKALGIEVVYDLDVPISTLPISDQKIVNLIGNLLSNSLDACEEWQKARNQAPLLTVQFYKRSGLYLLLCKNNSLPIPSPILDGLFQTYGKSTKGEAHEGLGTKIIKDIVEEHQGFLDFVHKDEEFEVKIKILAIQ